MVYIQVFQRCQDIKPRQTFFWTDHMTASAQLKENVFIKLYARTSLIQW